MDTDGPGRSNPNAVNMQEEEEFRRVSARPDVYDVIARSIAPSIYGSENMKKAIACLLFGGSRKRYEELTLCIFFLIPVSGYVKAHVSGDLPLRGGFSSNFYHFFAECSQIDEE